MPLIELKNLSHSYGEIKVIHNLSLTLESNQLICLLGSSGSGKTTILRLIAGLETPLSGSVVIDNKIVSENDKIVIAPQERSTGMIFQDLALWPHFTVYKNIALGLTERKDKNARKKVNDMLAFFGLTEHANKYPHQLSGGQKQLVAIARSLVLKPKILLMDEPLANLDVKLKRKILDHISNLIQEFNLTIIYVTHDHKEAFAIADKVVVLNKGTVEEEGSVEQIKESKNKYVKFFLEY